MTEPVPRFQVVPSRPRLSTRHWIVGIALAWLLSLLLVGWLVRGYADPGQGQARSQLRTAERAVVQQKQQLDELNQRLTTLARSDQISRAANGELQSSLAERDEEIASLRADVAFYERLVGSTAQRKGLNVHSIEFTPTDAGSWNYRAVLTQNLNRGAISQGKLRFSVEGVRGGKLATLGWDELHNTTGTPGQDYSFRYFQELGGNVMLPKDFTPQRVRVSLRGASGSVEQNFDWKPAAGGGSR